MDFTIVNKITILCARRNSGKSELVKCLVNKYRNQFDNIYCICPTEKVNNFYQNAGLVKPDCIFDKWSEEWANKLIEKMTYITKTKRKEVLLILDDLVGDTNFRLSKTIMTLFIRSRHIGISLIVNVQYLNTLSPLMRNNADFIICGQLNTNSVDILCDEYISKISKKEFMDMYNKCTKNYNFLIINNTSVKTDDIDELYQIIKCTL